MQTRPFFFICNALVLMLAAPSSLKAADTLLSSNFDDGTTQGWTLSGSAVLYHYTSGTDWSTSTPYAINLPMTGSDSYATLTTPLALLTKGYTSVTLDFDLKRTGGGFNVDYVDFSKDGGTTWINSYNNSSTYLPAHLTITVSGLANLSDNFKFRLHFTPNSPAYQGYVDNMVITASPNYNASYWDLNGVSMGACVSANTASGTWDGTNLTWNASLDGNGSISAWTTGQTAVFAAGTDATGSYTVTVDGTQTIGGLNFEEGTITLAAGTTPSLRLNTNSIVAVAPGLTATVETPLVDDGTARQLNKMGDGMLILSGNNATTASSTLLISAGTVRVDSPSAIFGTGRNVTINLGSAVMFGPSFGAGNIPTALLGRIVATSAGAIAADNYASTDFNFNAAGLTATSFGAVGTVNYTGTLTPNGTTYRLGGGGGVLKLNSALDSTKSLVVSGPGTVQLNGYSSTVTALSNTGSGAILENGSAANIILTVNSSADTSYGGVLADGTGGGTLTLTKTGNNTLLLSGSNTYSGGTVINSGRLNAASDAALGFSSGSITLNGGTLGANNGTGTARQNGININSAREVIVTSAGGSIAVSGNNNFTTSGKLSGTGTLTASDVGGAAGRALNFNATNNDFTGGISIPSADGMTFSVNSLADSANNIVFTKGGYATATFVYGSGAISDLTLNNRAIQINSASAITTTIKNNNTNYGITIKNNLVATGAGAKNLTLDAVAGPTNVFAGNITDGSGGGTVALSKAGAGIWTLSGNNNFSGTTTVSGGTLVLDAGTCLSDTNRLTIATGSKVQINPGIKELVGYLTLGSTTMDPGIYGSSASAAPPANQSTYFTGSGLLYVGVPLPPKGTTIRLR